MKYIFLSLVMLAVLVGCKSSNVSSTSKDAAQFESSMLYATPWRLVKIETPEKTLIVPEQEEATIVFNKENGKVSGRCCNSYFGTFNLTGNVVTFSNMGATKMFCQGIIGDVEVLYHSLLSVPQSIWLDTKKMEMKSEKGTLYFVAYHLE